MPMSASKECMSALATTSGTETSQTYLRYMSVQLLSQLQKRTLVLRENFLQTPDANVVQRLQDMKTHSM